MTRGADAMEKWRAAMVERGHYPRFREDGDLDTFFMESGFHNGPGCETCGWSCCWHCDGVEDIPQCSRPVVEATAVNGG